MMSSNQYTLSTCSTHWASVLVWAVMATSTCLCSLASLASLSSPPRSDSSILCLLRTRSIISRGTFLIIMSNRSLSCPCSPSNFLLITSTLTSTSSRVPSASLLSPQSLLILKYAWLRLYPLLLLFQRVLGTSTRPYPSMNTNRVSPQVLEAAAAIALVLCQSRCRPGTREM